MFVCEICTNTITMENNNKNQTNQQSDTETLKGNAAIDKLKELTEKAKTCFFCTNIKTGVPLTAIPMTVADVDDSGNIWFFSKKDSTKNEEIESDPFTHLFFQGSKFSDFLNVYGITEIVLDRQKIDELWKPTYEAWFDGGKDDPTISLLKVVPTQAHYWETKDGQILAFAKIALSAFTNINPDIGVEGHLEL